MNSRARYSAATGTRVNLQVASANEFPAKVPRPTLFGPGESSLEDAVA